MNKYTDKQIDYAELELRMIAHIKEENKKIYNNSYKTSKEKDKYNKYMELYNGVKNTKSFEKPQNGRRLAVAATKAKRKVQL